MSSPIAAPTSTTPEPSNLSRPISAKSRNSSIEDAFTDAATNATSPIITLPATISAAPAAETSLRIWSNSLAVSLASANTWCKRSSTWAGLVFNSLAMRSIVKRSCFAASRAARPVIASIRRTPEPIPDSDVKRKELMKAVLPT